jgi:hypothetical protein
MSEIVTHFKPGEIIALVAVIGGLMIPLAAILGGFWYNARLTAFKQDMFNRGMSPAEIQSVLTAGNKPTDESRRRHPCRC